MSSKLRRHWLLKKPWKFGRQKWFGAFFFTEMVISLVFVVNNDDFTLYILTDVAVKIVFLFLDWREGLVQDIIHARTTDGNTELLCCFIIHINRATPLSWESVQIYWRQSVHWVYKVREYWTCGRRGDQICNNVIILSNILKTKNQVVLSGLPHNTLLIGLYSNIHRELFGGWDSLKTNTDFTLLMDHWH